MAFKKRPLETLEYTSGDIVEDKAEVLVNTVNSRLSVNGNPVMGAGVAKAFRDKWGDAVMEPYAEAIKSGELRPGRAVLFDLPDGRKWAALATKDDWRDKSQMEWVENGLKELGEKLRDGGYKSVAITPPGCGNGGLDWKKVEPIVHRELEGVNVHMFAKPSGAMSRSIQDIDNEAKQRTNPAVLAKARDSKIKSQLIGKISDEPEASYTLSGHSPGRCSFEIRMSISEEGRPPKPVFLRSDEMDREHADKAIEEFRGLRKDDKVTLAGGWIKRKHGPGWGFVAQRMAKGEIPLSGLKSTSPSPKVIGDPHFKDILAGSLEVEKAAANRLPKAAIEDENTFRGKPIAEKGSMYFSYGWEARSDIKSQTTFDAILDGERTSTTRFDKWNGSDRWGRLKPGDLVRFYEDREMEGRSVVVKVDSVDRIDMRNLTDEQREDWSKAEGWSTTHAKKSAERYGSGFQVRYHPVPGQDILEGRGAQISKSNEFDFDAATAPSQAWDKRESSVFLKTTEKFGSLSNMARGHGYKDGTVSWKSSEAQYQALKFPDHPEIQEEIRNASNAYLAKKVAYKYPDKVRKDWDKVSVQAMAYVLTRKYDASPSFREELAEATADGKSIVEFSKKSTFWGAAPDGYSLRGQNVLGRLENQLQNGARMDVLPEGSRLIGVNINADQERSREETRQMDLGILSNGRVDGKSSKDNTDQRKFQNSMAAALASGFGR